MTKQSRGTWGRSSRSSRVHYYKDGMTLCGQSRKMDMEFPDWNPDDPDTCRKVGLFTAGQRMEVLPTVGMVRRRERSTDTRKHCSFRRIAIVVD